MEMSVEMSSAEQSGGTGWVSNTFMASDPMVGSEIARLDILVIIH